MKPELHTLAGLFCRAAWTEARCSICWASLRFRALAECCCCIVALIFTAGGCLFLSMLVKLWWNMLCVRLSKGLGKWLENL